MNSVYRVSDMWFKYSHEWTLREVSFNIMEGEIFGVIGPNGSGKSTLLRLLSKIIHPQKGTIYLKDIDITTITEKKMAEMVALVPQESFFLFPYTVGEIVLMGRTPCIDGFFEESKDVETALMAMELTGIQSLSDRGITEISGGERQRTIIARALAQETDILILDEPIQSIDIGYQIEILNLLQDLNEKKGLTIILSTHDLNIAALYCHRLILLKEGMIYSMGAPEEVITESNIQDVYSCPVIVDTHPMSEKPRITLKNKI